MEDDVVVSSGNHSLHPHTVTQRDKGEHDDIEMKVWQL